MNIDFQPFDYANLPDSGMYWLAGTRPVYDIDADADGRTVGQPTGEVENFTALVWLDVYANKDGPQGGYHIDPVDAGNLGNFDESSTIQYFAEVKKAAHPHDVEDKLFSIEGEVIFQRSDEPGASNCVCCPPGQNHVFSRYVRWDTRSQGLDFHYSKSADDLVRKLTGKFTNEGRRIKLTAELVDETPPQAPAL